MSIVGQSFNPLATGARIDFGVGTAGLANLFASGWTIAALARQTNANFGFLAGYSDAPAGTAQGQAYTSNNAGGRLFGLGDFSNGFPDPVDDADGLNDNVWRWYTTSLATTAAGHYQFGYADLATRTWVHGESVPPANHGNSATPCVAFSTGSVYPLGFNQGDLAAVVAWPVQLTPAQAEASCTLSAADLYAVSPPRAGWLFPQATAGTAPVLDFTGGGADETARQLVAASADPPGFSFALAAALVITNPRRAFHR